MPFYCALGGQPTLANANTPVPSQVVNTTTSFTCNAGYASSGGATPPFYKCNPSTIAAGSWDPTATYTCQRTLELLLLSSHTLESDLLFRLYSTEGPQHHIHKHWFAVLCLEVIQGYCPLPAPSLAYASNSTAPVQTIGGVTYFTCNSGYATNGASQPYFSCNAGTSTVGVWSNVTYNCTGTVRYTNT